MAQSPPAEAATPQGENLSEFEKFLANRKAGKSDAEFYANQKAERDRSRQAGADDESESDEDWLSNIKYKPPS